MSSGRLHGKVALITGAASGQGRAEAILFAEEGAAVIAADVSEIGLKQLEADIAGEGGRHLFPVHDVSSESDWIRTVAKAVERFGRIDILVNNAGILSTRSILDTTPEEWDRINNVNARGTFLGMRAVIPVMQQGGGGSIINISSTAGVVGEPGAAYTASKGAVRTLTKHAAVDLAPDRIRVNSVHPGTVITPMISELLENPQKHAELKRLTPLPPHFGQPEDVAPGVLYLASDESRFVTGSELVIDGGFLAL